MLRERSEAHSASAAPTLLADSSPLSELRGTPQVDDAATLDSESSLQMRLLRKGLKEREVTQGMYSLLSTALIFP
jgi:hypothetical protein